MQDPTDLIIAALIGGLPVSIHDRVDAAESMLQELDCRIADILHGSVESSPAAPLPPT